jgi:hypothetical protein
VRDTGLGPDVSRPGKRDGVTGFLRCSVEEMASVVAETADLSPQKCRHHVATSFSAEVMVAGYEEVYEQVLNRS